MAEAFAPNSQCLLTGAPAQIRERPGGEDAYEFTSQPCGTYVVSRTLAASTVIWERIADRLYLIAALARRYSDSGRTLRLMTSHLTDAEVLEELLEGLTAPADPLELIDRFILFVRERTSHAAEWVFVNDRRDFTTIAARNDEEFIWAAQQASRHGLVEFEQIPTGWEARLTPEGWRRVRDLESRRLTSNQAFVAMSFAPELTSAWTDGIEPALRETAWLPIRVDGIEHNEKIDDLIISEIRKSGLVVADFTLHRPNVYFEAGFARGLGIPVIWTCRSDQMGDAQFDTRQYNHIVWDEPATLRERLRLRIIASGPAPRR